MLCFISSRNAFSLLIVKSTTYVKDNVAAYYARNASDVPIPMIG
jgi:hypothetical protein